jgi:hypothetical protein
MSHRTTIIAAAAALVFVTAPAARAVDISANDTARFLAGMPPAADSPVAALTKDRAWQYHASAFDHGFEHLEHRQLARIRAWSASNVSTPRPTMFYMFSGPDFLYANAFFPNATTYVLAGLEPVGTVPDLASLRGANLSQLRASLNSVLSYSFFITHNMKSDLRAGRVNGTLPLLYVFLARSGKAIREVTLVKLDNDGAVQPDLDPVRGNATHGVKIVFAGSDGEARTLYYFSTDLSDGGVKSSKFLEFCATLAPGDSLLKSASYLPHSGNFSKVRAFLLANSAAIVQDDSGIPLGYFDAKKWDLQPFGRYLGPIGVFPGRYQSNYAVLFRKGRPIDFGIGYRWRPNESNLLLAAKTSADEVAGDSVREASSAPASEEGAAHRHVSQAALHRRDSAARQSRAPARQTPRSPFEWFRFSW